MQTLNVDKVIKEDHLSEIVENVKGATNTNPKFTEWEERDVLIRSWLSGTMTEESMFLITGCQTAKLY